MSTKGLTLRPKTRLLAKNFIGQRFGRRVVLGEGDRKSKYRGAFYLWRMRCDCGGVDDVPASYVFRGRANTCVKCSRSKRGPDCGNWKGCGVVPSTAFANFKASAQARDIEFNLTIEDIAQLYRDQNGKCALSGVELVFRRGSHKRWNGLTGNASLDRKDSNKSYTIDNVWLVTTSVNFAKQSLSVEEFIQMCKAVAARAEAAE